MNCYIEIKCVEKIFYSGNGKRKKAADGISVKLQKGETLGLIGTSGCGKTTVLKMIMGLLEPDAGSVTVEGTLGFVAQDPYASLDPTMTVFRIVAEPLIFSRKKRTYQDCEEEVKKVLDYVHLKWETYRNRLPSQLSGGERQRVSIARALILKPDFLILDEPTSMLDQEVKTSIIALISHIAKSGRFGFLLVTHDITMCAKVCEKLIVMSEGRVIEEGKAERILESPRHDVTKGLMEVSLDLKKYWERYCPA